MNTKVLFKNTKAFRRLAKVYKDNKFIQNALYNWHKTDLLEKDCADFIYGYTFGERVALTEEVIEFGVGAYAFLNEEWCDGITHAYEIMDWEEDVETRIENFFNEALKLNLDKGGDKFWNSKENEFWKRIWDDEELEDLVCYISFELMYKAEWIMLEMGTYEVNYNDDGIYTGGAHYIKQEEKLV